MKERVQGLTKLAVIQNNINNDFIKMSEAALKSHRNLGILIIFLLSINTIMILFLSHSR